MNIGDILKIQPIKVTMGKVELYQDELLEVLAKDNATITVKRLFSGEVVTVPIEGLKYVI